MARWFWHVRTYCSDPAHEQEFNDWYNNVHIPDALASPGFVSATRYEIETQTEKSGKYLTIYEIESDDIRKTMAIRDERREKERAIGAYDGGGQYVVTLGAVHWKQMYPTFTKDNTPPAPHAHKANP
jgi:hypothetical protein